MRARPLLLSLVVVVAACGEPPVTPGVTQAVRTATVVETESYVLIGSGNALPGDLSAAVAAAGGTVTGTQDEIGVAFAASSDPDFAAKAAAISGIQAVAPDIQLVYHPAELGSGEATAEELATEPTSTEQSHGSAHVGASETYRNVQWNVDAIQAPAAWQLGALGQGARVAILDGGIFSSHQDLDANLDVAASRSFVAGRPYNDDSSPHATHVAGIVAAEADNNTGIVGVAPKATIIGVKIAHAGSGNFSAMVDGIMYAARPRPEGAGAHIINISVGATYVHGGESAAHLLRALNRAVAFARQQGTIVIAAAGNDALDLNRSANTVSMPAQAAGVVAVAATGPVGFGLGETNFDRPASYTNYGQSGITFAGPGGDTALPGNAGCPVQIIPRPLISLPCWWLDRIVSLTRSARGVVFLSGTSQAAPAVAGVAALVVGKYGPMSAADLEARLRASADDLGKPGKDAYYGHGRVNALRAVQ